MELMLGVAAAVKSMHQFRVSSSAADTRAARAVRREGEEADEDLARRVGQPKRSNGPRMEDSEDQPLMADEVTQSQEGVQDGGIRPYAHRDIKPGELI